IWSKPAGKCGVVTIVLLIIYEVNERKLSILKFAKLLLSNPAKNSYIFLKKVSLMVSTFVHITIIIMEIDRTIKNEDFDRKSKISAYVRFDVKGKPIQKIVRGKKVM